MSDNINSSNFFEINLISRVKIKPPIDDMYELRKSSFELINTEGSIERATKILNSRGYKQRRGGEVVSSSCRRYAMDYLLNYPDEARKFIQTKGLFPDTDQGNIDWLVYLVSNAAKTYISKVKFITWAVHSGYYKKAFYLFKRTYNLSDRDYNAFDDVLGI